MNSRRKRDDFISISGIPDYLNFFRPGSIGSWEEKAIANIAIAIRLDSQGHKGEAIEYYRRAIDAYDKLFHSYPITA